MSQTAEAPEQTVRRYLDEHDGREDVSVAQLMTTWHLEQWTDRERSTVSSALQSAGVNTEPPLAQLERSDPVCVYVAPEFKTSAPPLPWADYGIQTPPVYLPPPPPPNGVVGHSPALPRRSRWWIGGLVAVALALVGSVAAVFLVVRGDRSQSRPQENARPAASDAERPVDRPVALGDPAVLKTQETELRVRVTGIIDPLPAGEFDEPADGKRFVGVRMSLRNIGSGTYNDSVSNGSALILKSSEQVDPTLLSGGPCDSSFSSDVKVATGDTRTGCIPFEVPNGARLRSFQFTPDSGFAGTMGEWDVRNAPSSGTPPAGGTAAPSFTACDPNISVETGTTTCAFAQNVFYEYWTSGRSSDVSAYSPVTGQTYATQCSNSGGQIGCTTTSGAEVRFPQSAVDAYDQAQADRYAATHQTGP